MRLTTMEQDVISNSFRQCFGEGDHLWLFGSRINDQKRGGDIDLYVETHLDSAQAIRSKFSFLSVVKDKIGDQRIDIILNILSLGSSQLICKIARSEGIQLV
ncbi:MAG: nucleotidyltransferase domain-containing protein [Alphaproteobacteria bacterium]|nr:nucleotidyltransferase domain-containing protein [Alphaproteobacteria bacterium]